jgi:diaminopimelate epimerase
MRQKIQFSKMHGLGNDFVVVDAVRQRFDVDYSDFAQAVCDRNFGVGGDGLILVLPSDHSDLRMRIFNTDGSEPQMCGNGIRCFAKFAYEEGLVEKDVISVETLAGVMVITLGIQAGHVSSVEVDMGPPRLRRAEIPMLGGDPSSHVLRDVMDVKGQSFEVTAVSMGNPHAVIFVPDTQAIEIDVLGPLFERHAIFPERTNTEFVQIVSPTEAIMRVWERGAGETLACGTGACAVVVAGILNGLLSQKVTVHLPGGDLLIEWQQGDKHVIMSGPATLVFKGEIEL